MRIRSLYSLIAPFTTYFRLTRAQAPNALPVSGANSTNQAIFAGIRSASTMAIDDSQMNVLNGPLQPHSRQGDTTHPTGFFRDGYCWGRREDGGKHFIGGVVTNEFLEYSKSKGNDLMTPRPGFVGLKEGCRWCLCVERWKEALMASETMGERVVPRVDLSSTAMDALRIVKKEDLERFAVSRS